MFSKNVVLDKDHLQHVVRELSKQDAFVFDVESLGANRNVPTQNELAWIGLASRGQAYAIPFGHPNGNVVIQKASRRKDKETGLFVPIPVRYDAPPPQLRPSQVFDALQPLFFSDRAKIAHNAPFDLLSVFKYFGELPPPPYRDTIVMQWLVNENLMSLGLKNLTKAEYKVDYDKENVGRRIEDHPFNKVGHYTFMDSRYEWLHDDRLLAEIEAEGLQSVFDLEMDVLSVLLDMGLEGAPVDVDQLHVLRDELSVKVVEAEADIYRAAGRNFNINSPQQKVHVLFDPKSEGGQGLKPKKLTKGGMKKEKNNEAILLTDYSTDAETLETYSNKVTDALLLYADVNKLLSTYVLGYLGVEGDPDKPCRIFNGKIHADFVQYGTVTGRFSCVSGSTLLETNRGTFTFEEYIPMDGDLVVSHQGRWMPVRRKYYNGVEDIYRVTLSNGNTLECTQEHRIFTPTGWVCVRDLIPGAKVYADGSFIRIPEQPRAHSACAGNIPIGGEANDTTDGGNVWDYVSDREPLLAGQLGPRNVPAGEGTSILSFESREPESNDRKVWFPTPQLSGGDTNRTRVPPTQGGTSVRPITQGCVCNRLGYRLRSKPFGSTSYRWGQDEQFTGQFGTGDEVWACQIAWEEVTVREVAFVAPMGVWDIEVEGDHSYVTQGFINHNCREPNLQNIPRPDSDLGKKIRGLFVAPEGHRLVVSDYSAIEMFILAHFIGRGALFEGLIAGVDPHTATAAAVFKIKPEDVTPAQRFVAKGLNFAIVYGAGPDKVAKLAKVSVRDAKKFMEMHEAAFPEIYRFKDHVLETARARKPVPYLKTLLGRKRRLPGLNSGRWTDRGYAERQAFNSLIQGSAADIIKLAMVRLNRELPQDMRLILTIHDELIVICPEDRTELCAKIMREAMLGEEIQALLKVPLKSDLKVVSRWAEAKE